MRLRVALVLLAVTVGFVATAPPAAAHGGQGAEPVPATSYRTTINAVTPEVDGLVVHVREAGSRIELTNRTASEVVVLGYEGEPYLRVGADGVFENLRSPSTYLNADRQGRAPIPPDADAAAEPEWRKLAGGSTARWHDHRAHWMGDIAPPAVAADPSTEHVITAGWEIPLQVGDRPVTITGDLTWVPGPSRWPWLAGAVLLAVLGVLGARRCERVALPVITAVLLAATGAQAVGAWTGATGGAVEKIAALSTPALAWFVLLAGLSQLRRARVEALLVAGASAVGLGWLFGLAHIGWLASSQLPTGLNPDAARLAIAATLGSATALVAHAAISWRQRTPVRTSPSPPASAKPPGGLRAVVRRDRRVLAAGLAAGVAALVVVAVLTIDDEPSPAAAPATLGVHAELCAALRSGDADEAAAQFTGRIHTPLHELAAAAQVQDRAAAARLLEAKQRVEATLDGDRTALLAQLDALEPVVRDALAVTGTTTTPCQENR